MHHSNLKKLALGLGMIVSSSAFAATDDAATKVNWSYSGNTGPAHWAELSPDFAACGNGSTQTPIDIPASVQNLPYMLNFGYRAAPLEIEEDGITGLMLGQRQVLYNDGHTVQLNFQNVTENVNFNGTDYQLSQLHFHSPSETTLQGKSFPLEIHFVHQEMSGKAAVIAVFVKEGPPNPVLQQIIDHLPQTRGTPVSIAGVSINPMQLLPAQHNYYTFMGSLTTPPCTEGLTWFVMMNPITASAAQISALQAAIGGPNARPVQPINKRVITAAAQKI